jgi:hypothetical protein
MLDAFADVRYQGDSVEARKASVPRRPGPREGRMTLSVPGKVTPGPFPAREGAFIPLPSRYSVERVPTPYDH